MPQKRKIVCIMCPLGCNMTATIDNKGDIISLTDYQCKEGKKYAMNECKFSGRVLTTTILTKSSVCKLLPVRSNGLIPKDRLMGCAQFLAKVRVKPPVKMGQIISRNILDTRVDVISSDELLR
jgi:CxxC motif-containing protein